MYYRTSSACVPYVTVLPLPVFHVEYCSSNSCVPCVTVLLQDVFHVLISTFSLFCMCCCPSSAFVPYATLFPQHVVHVLLPFYCLCFICFCNFSACVFCVTFPFLPMWIALLSSFRICAMCYCPSMFHYLLAFCSLGYMYYCLSTACFGCELLSFLSLCVTDLPQSVFYVLLFFQRRFPMWNTVFHGYVSYVSLSFFSM